MVIKPFEKDAHYLMVCQWWDGHGFPCIPSNKLPPFGWMSCDDEGPVVAAFAYLDNGGTGVAMIEWIVANPTVRGPLIVKHLKNLMEFMTTTLHEEFDYDFILTTCRHQGLAKLLEKCGFTRTDGNMIHLTKAYPAA